jgi:hypothetical protein
MSYLDIVEPEIFICQSNDDFSRLVYNLKSKYLSLWWKVESVFPASEIQYDKRVKLIKEKEMNRFIDEFNLHIEHAVKEKDENKVNKEEMINLLKTNLNSIFGFGEDSFNVFFNKNFPDVTNNFVKQAREFNPQIDIHDIYQAMRNVWIINTVQLLFDKSVSLTPSIFAYSMLYPYTDNYLDNPELPAGEKLEFNKRFKKRLAGEDVLPINKHEEDIFKLVSIVEGQFPRTEFPGVYNSMLAIHHAQEKSLAQQNENSIPYENDILGISFEKGGTSVLVDGYLVKGDLKQNELDFLFGFGVFLQIIDDLSDIEENTKNRQMTIFSQTSEKYLLDKLTNRLYWFMKKTLDSSNCFPSSNSDMIHKIIERSCASLIIDSVFRYKKCFSRDYVRELEKYSIFRLGYHKKFKRRIKNLFMDRYKKSSRRDL